MNKRDKRVFQKILGYCAKVAKAHQIFHDDKALFLDEEDGFVYRDTISMSILQIGELSKALTQEMRDAHPDIPWHDIVGMRDVAVHHYGALRYGDVWDTSQKDVPALEKKVRLILAMEENNM